MAINRIRVTLYQDNKRNTATAYLRFNDIKQEIYVGFDLTNTDTTYYEYKAKVKGTRQLISGVRAGLDISPNTTTLYLIIDHKEYTVSLKSTDDYPVTHKGEWHSVVPFAEWFDNQSSDRALPITEFLNEIH